MSRYFTFLLATFVVWPIGSGGCRHSTDPEANDPTDEARADQLVGAEAPETGVVALTARLEGEEQIAITLSNGTNEVVGFRRVLAVEQETSDGWVALEAIGDLWIREECVATDGVLFPEGQRDRCLELAATTQIEVPPWLGTFGDAQCACERCAHVPAARYRIVAETCSGERIESAPVAIRLDDE